MGITGYNLALEYETERANNLYRARKFLRKIAQDKHISYRERINRML